MAQGGQATDTRGFQPAALPTELSPKYGTLNTSGTYIGEPYNQQVFEHPPSTVRRILFPGFIT